MAVKLRRMQSTYGIPVAVVAILSFVYVRMHWSQGVAPERVQGGTELLHSFRQQPPNTGSTPTIPG